MESNNLFVIDNISLDNAIMRTFSGVTKANLHRAKASGTVYINDGTDFSTQTELTADEYSALSAVLKQISERVGREIQDKFAPR
ncbi:MAG TPA: hypothetical protein VD835_03825 [Pyrinomonadaceae bacterium]|nr:hypothetical protein [Pyrinomonadaceae bacterium]